MSTTTSKPSLADAIRAALDAYHAGGRPVGEMLRAALPAAEAADALAEAVEAMVFALGLPEGRALCSNDAWRDLRNELSAALRRDRGAK